MTSKFYVQYPYKDNVGRTIVYYPITKVGQKQAINDLKYYKAKLHRMLEEKDQRIATLEAKCKMLEEDYQAAIEMVKYQ